MWRPDVELSRRSKLRRAIYKTLRNELDYALIQYGLIDGYNRMLKAGQEYSFVEKRELKPRGKVTEAENELLAGFIVFFCEESVPGHLKKYIRYFSDNKVTKENLPEIVLNAGRIAPDLLRIQRNFEHTKFLELLKALLPVDYALLIQQDKAARGKTRYALTHFHVRVDWLIDFAAEALGKEMRYISKDLYENGEKYAMDMGEKLFEYYGFHHTVSGRRTAAVVAAQLLSKTDFISSVYVNSAESRTLTRISEKGVSKFCLVKIPREHIEKFESGDSPIAPNFRKDYLICEAGDHGIALFQAAYTHNEHSSPPADGKLRTLQPDVFWLKAAHQLILPKPKAMDREPIPYPMIYSQQDVFPL